MRFKVFPLYLCLAALLASLTASEIAVAGPLAPAEHGIEFLENHNHADDDASGESQDQEGAPCHALVHHHCSVSIVAGEALLALPFDERRTTIRPPDAMPMSSLAQAPPTQPPSA